MDKDKFFDRKEIIEAINKRVLSFTQGYRQNIAILGDELVGKTTAVKHYLNNYLTSQIIPIYIPVYQNSPDYFIRHFCGALLQSFLKSKGSQNYNGLGLESLLTETQELIPQTVEKIKDIESSLGKHKPEVIFQMLFDLPNILKNEAQSLIILVIDEFHNLEDIVDKNIFKQWGKFIILQKDVLYVLISSFKAKAKKILQEQLSLLFGNFEIIELEMFDYKIADEFISFNLNNIHLSPIYKEFIINIFGGSPFYLKVFSWELFVLTKLKEKNILSLEDIIDVLEGLLFSRSGKFYIKFDYNIYRLANFKNSLGVIDILLAISCGVNKLKDMGIKLSTPKKDLLQKLNRLAEMNVVSQNGAFYKINDRVFSLWLRLVYKVKCDFFGEDTDYQKELFRSEIKNMFNMLTQESQKKSPDRIVELFNLFKGDSIHLERRRIKLTDFREIRFLGFNDKDLPPHPKRLTTALSIDRLQDRNTLAFRAGCGGVPMLISAKDRDDTLWIVFLKEDMITEDDIVEFSNRLKNNDKAKIKKKIIIGLSYIEPNARLKALQEKMLIWDLKNINQLFEFYGKPAIVR